MGGGDGFDVSYLIVGLIPVGQAEIEVLDVEVQVGRDELVLDHLPDDPIHRTHKARSN
jgi:hypothetical protein